MKMEVLAVQTQYGILGSNKVKDWTSTLTNSTTPSPLSPKSTTNKSSSTNNTNSNSLTTNNSSSNNNNNNNNTTSNNKNSITKTKSKMCNKRNLPTKQQINSFPYNTTHHISSSLSAAIATSAAAAATAANINNTNTTTINNSIIQNPYTTTNGTSSNLRNLCNGISDSETATAVNELSMRLLDELRAAKSRHLTCTEVSLPCDLTPCIAAEILRVSEKEPCGIRGCTIYIEFEDEPNNSRRIASLKIDPETVSTFEVYLTLRQDHRGWTSLLPQFMKSLARTITISPEFTITKHKLYSPQHHSSYNYNSNTGSSAVPIAAPTS